MDEKLNRRVEQLAEEFPFFRDDLNATVQDIDSYDWKDALTSCRRMLEAIESAILFREFNEEPKPGKGDHLGKVLQKFPRHLQPAVRYVREMGNLGAHWQEVDAQPPPEQIERTLDFSCDLIEWYIERYGKVPRPGSSRPPTGRVPDDQPRPGSGRPPSSAEPMPSSTSPTRRAVPSGATEASSAAPSTPEAPAAKTEDTEDEVQPAQTRKRWGWSFAGTLLIGAACAIILVRNPRVLPLSFSSDAAPAPPAPPVSPPAPPLTAPPDREWTRQDSRTSQDLHDVWGDGTTLYAVGDGGTFLVTRDGGRRWHPLQSGTKLNLFGVFGFPDGPVVAVGDGGTLLCIDAAAAAPTPCTKARPTKALLYSVWGHSSTAIYAVGDKGVILNSQDQGRTWTLVRQGGSALRRVSGAGPGEVWAIGWDGTVRRSPKWELMPASSAIWLYDLWMSSTADPLLVGTDQTDKAGVLLRIPRTGGKATLLRRQVNPLYTLWGRDATDLRIAGVGREILHGDGVRLEPEPIAITAPSGRPPTFKRLFGTAAGDLYLVGLNGVIAHRQLAPTAGAVAAEGPAAAR